MGRLVPGAEDGSGACSGRKPAAFQREGDVLGPADDEFHPGSTDDRSWTETAWFAAAVPERGLAVWTYAVLSACMGQFRLTYINYIRS
jgi:hypothetical protein